MDTEKYIEKFTFPNTVSMTLLDKNVLLVKGPKGEVSKSFLHPLFQVSIEGNELIFIAEKFSKIEKKLMQTFLAHANNLAKGVVDGCEYKLKICSGHFPMNVSLKGNVLEIKNFIGEAVPRKIIIKEGIKVSVEGDKIIVTGVDIGTTSQMAASIEKLTRRNGFDKRNFQDGIYIIEKNGKKIE